MKIERVFLRLQKTTLSGVRGGTVNTRSLVASAALLLYGFGSIAFAQPYFGGGFGRGGPGGPGGGPGWDRGPGRGGDPGRGGPGRGGGRDDRDGGFDRREPDMRGAYQIGQTIISDREMKVIQTNAQVSQIKLCAAYDDLQLYRLEVVLGRGHVIPINTRDQIRRGTCTNWKDLPGFESHVVQIRIAGESDHDLNNTQVVIYGRMNHAPPPPPPPRRFWTNWSGGQNSCGDGSGPFIRDQYNNRVPVMACPDQKPNGGPIGQPCDHLAPGTLCYGWSYQTQPGFYCAAPNGMTPPYIATIFSMYQCQ